MKYIIQQAMFFDWQRGPDISNRTGDGALRTSFLAGGSRPKFR